MTISKIYIALSVNIIKILSHTTQRNFMVCNGNNILNECIYKYFLKKFKTICKQMWQVIVWIAYFELEYMKQNVCSLCVLFSLSLTELEIV